MPKFRLNPLAMDTFGRLAGIRAYLDLLDKEMSAIEAKEREHLQETAETQGWDYSDYDVERQVLDERFGHWIPRFSAYSAIILLYTIVEVQLVDCAAALAKRTESPFSIGDLRGRGIETAILFIERLAKHDVKAQDEWQYITDLRTLRNLIVHRIGTRGQTDAHQHEADRLAARYSGQLEFPKTDWSYREGFVSMSLCRTFVDKVEAFYTTLFRALNLPEKGVEVITG